ncbi:hypothetical protein DFQ27_008495 [Actinomortierella ambigua]|uniref:GHMP kinase N-terminal domain-containing protein n=1 Tax=Actinomortierella ambigua TaxID=1343610 RepID=A0A9P6PQE7_9FUNG|nr:hypothetical protein DFQ27_008495 [Actinomortierella ambigua]
MYGSTDDTSPTRQRRRQRQRSRRIPQGVDVVATAPARIDLAGGWTDTPPVCFEHGARVVNMAVSINGKHPFMVRGRRTPRLSIVLPHGDPAVKHEFTTREELDDHQDPTAPCALLKACIVASGILDDFSSSSSSSSDEQDEDEDEQEQEEEGQEQEHKDDERGVSDRKKDRENNIQHLSCRRPDPRGHQLEQGKQQQQQQTSLTTIISTPMTRAVHLVQQRRSPQETFNCSTTGESCTTNTNTNTTTTTTTTTMPYPSPLTPVPKDGLLGHGETSKTLKGEVCRPKSGDGDDGPASSSARRSTMTNDALSSTSTSTSPIPGPSPSPSPRRTPSPSSSSSLEDVLRRTGGGIEMEMTSTLPVGSGMGTSSILAAAALAVLSTLQGRRWQRETGEEELEGEDNDDEEEEEEEGEEREEREVKKADGESGQRKRKRRGDGRLALGRGRQQRRSMTSMTRRSGSGSINSRTMTTDELLTKTLEVEQRMRTGGGWQDQVGGVLPGLKVGAMERQTQEQPLQLSTRVLDMADETVAAIDQRLLLIYTGQTRLAANLLQTVLGQWAGRDPLVVRTMRELVEDATLCEAKLEQGDLASVGEIMTRYFSLKRYLSSTRLDQPPVVAELTRLLTPFMDGSVLAGAGGGGFLAVLLREGVDREAVVQQVREQLGRQDRAALGLTEESEQSMWAWQARIDRQGLYVRVEERIE